MYEACDLTRQESVLLIMSFALWHNLTDAALKHLLQLINCHLPRQQLSSMYHFLKQYPVFATRTYYYCPTCLIILEFNSRTFLVCNECGIEFDKKRLKKYGNFFLYLPLKEQLMQLVNSSCFQHFRKRCDESDVINGKVYKRLREKNIIADTDISLQWNTDGITMCKSSKYTLWPIQVSVNELPYRIRKNNVLLCGLWYMV